MADLDNRIDDYKRVAGILEKWKQNIHNQIENILYKIDMSMEFHFIAVTSDFNLILSQVKNMFYSFIYRDITVNIIFDAVGKTNDSTRLKVSLYEYSTKR